MEAWVDVINVFAAAKDVCNHLYSLLSGGQVGFDTREGIIEHIADGALLNLDWRRTGGRMKFAYSLLCT